MDEMGNNLQPMRDEEDDVEKKLPFDNSANSARAANGATSLEFNDMVSCLNPL